MTATEIATEILDALIPRRDPRYVPAHSFAVACLTTDASTQRLVRKALRDHSPDPDDERVASPHAEESAEAPRTSPALPTADPPASPVSLIPTGKEEESPKEGAERRPAPSPVSVWDCEVDRYGEDGPCKGPIIFDEVTHGRFCETHMVAVPSGRAEWHRRNAARNRPAPVARLAG